MSWFTRTRPTRTKTSLENFYIYYEAQLESATINARERGNGILVAQLTKLLAIIKKNHESYEKIRKWDKSYTTRKQHLNEKLVHIQYVLDNLDSDAELIRIETRQIKDMSGFEPPSSFVVEDVFSRIITDMKTDLTDIFKYIQPKCLELEGGDDSFCTGNKRTREQTLEDTRDIIAARKARGYYSKAPLREADITQEYNTPFAFGGKTKRKHRHAKSKKPRKPKISKKKGKSKKTRVKRL